MNQHKENERVVTEVKKNINSTFGDENQNNNIATKEWNPLCARLEPPKYFDVVPFCWLLLLLSFRAHTCVRIFQFLLLLIFNFRYMSVWRTHICRVATNLHENL